MKRIAIILISALLTISLLVGGCTQEEIDKYLTEMGGLAGDLDAIDAAAAQGKWQEAKNSLEQAQMHHSNIDAGIDDLEASGIEPLQIERGRVASTYLHKAVDIIENMLAWHMTLPELNMEGLSEATKEEVAEAVSKLNELNTIAESTKSSIEEFLDYAGIYNSNNPDDAKKMKADSTIPHMKKLYNDLDARQAEFQEYIDKLSKAL